MSSNHKQRNSVKGKSEMSSLSKLYLIGYNSLQTVGWGYVFIQSMKYLLQNKSATGLYAKYGLELLLFQSLAALEILHAAIGLVSSNPVMTFIQVFSRLFQVWGIIYSVPEVQDINSIGLLIFAWGLTEIVRYSYYAACLIGTKSSFLTWCRYSLFYVLYPTGVFAETSIIYKALSFIKKRQIYSFMLPNPMNISFSYYYANIFLILTYAPLFPMLFNHMRRQRAKILGTTEKEKANGQSKKYS